MDSSSSNSEGSYVKLVPPEVLVKDLPTQNVVMTGILGGGKR